MRTLAIAALVVLSGCAGAQSFFGVRSTTTATAPKRPPIQVTVACTTPPYSKEECETVRTVLVRAGYNVTTTPTTSVASTTITRR